MFGGFHLVILVLEPAFLLFLILDPCPVSCRIGVWFWCTAWPLTDALPSLVVPAVEHCSNVSKLEKQNRPPEHWPWFGRCNSGTGKSCLSEQTRDTLCQLFSSTFSLSCVRTQVVRPCVNWGATVGQCLLLCFGRFFWLP
uniref:Putative secreted protein n=1 Tax=Anopheles triannulatus TaxID=58253 RepID=A0A2M4B6K1_9DIPT